MQNALKLIMILFCFVAGTTMTQAQQQYEYEVKQGETLYAISKKLNVTIAELKLWNGIQNNEIYIGQVLRYYRSENEDANNVKDPDSESMSLIKRDAPDINTFYNVKSGDNLYTIAKTYNMTVTELKELNNLESDNIMVGQRLAVKKPSVAPSVSDFEAGSTPQGTFSVYSIQRGEDLSAILKKFKMSGKEFTDLNPGVDVNQLSRGQEVTVLLPPTSNYPNPYLQKADLQDLGEVKATVYDETDAGETTTNGELYDPNALTAAHSSIALGTIVFIENPANGKGIYVRVNDRITAGGIKLSNHAYESLGLAKNENASVNIYLES